MDKGKLRDKLKKIQVLAMDVDGTLTDAKVYYSKNGEELKKFSIRDGMGIELLRLNGIQTAIVTSENSQIVISRASKLNIDHIILGSRSKKKDLNDLADKLSLSMENLAYMGDDVNDIHAIEAVGVGACPADAADSVRYIADYICEAQGGNGAVREFIELILKAQNLPVTLPENW